MKTTATLISLLALTAPAAAQTAEPTKPAPCQAEPQANAQQDAQSAENGQGDSATQKLAPCGGVLKPPPTGDSEMTEPAPDAGKTPVIKPGEVPAQPPKQD
jgi:hypothetical protein